MPASRRFEPAWWLPGPHLQTVWASCTRRFPSHGLRRERLELPDGDFLDLDWKAEAAPDAPTVLVLHGLEGSSRSPYARGMLGALVRQGWRAAVMHFRGCSGEPNRLERGYHSGDTADLAHVVQRLSDRSPAPVAAIGFSLGGNVLLKWLGESGAANPLLAAAAVSVPFSLGDCARRLEHGASRLYQWWLMRSMRASVRRKFRLRSAPFDLARVATCRTFHQFDDLVTAPLHGFAGVEDYYARSSCRQFLPGIRRPTLIIQARDDPFMMARSLPDRSELSAATTFELYREGGHVGFVGGRVPGRARYWLEERICGFLAQASRGAEAGRSSSGGSTRPRR